MLRKKPRIVDPVMLQVQIEKRTLEDLDHMAINMEPNPMTRSVLVRMLLDTNVREYRLHPNRYRGHDHIIKQRFDHHCRIHHITAWAAIEEMMDQTGVDSEEQLRKAGLITDE